MQWALDFNLPSSGIREILNRAVAIPGAIRLETGEPNFPPPAHVLDAYVRASRQGYNRYTASEGIRPLREAISEKLARVNQVNRSPEEILITPGGIPGLFLAFMGTAEKGSEILVPDPGWPDYLGGLVSLGIRPRPYRLKAPEYTPDLADLSSHLTSSTRAIILNTPSNPTGRIFSRAVIEAIVDWAERHDLWIISDEVYDQIIFDGHVTTPAALAPQRTLSIYSFSKTYAMTGWRLGYLAGPRSAIESLTRVAMGAWSSVSEPLQYAGLAALQGSQDMAAHMLAAYQSRRDLAMRELEHRGITTSQPEGAFYLLIDIGSTGLPSRIFALRFLAEEEVGVAPGSAFGNESEGWVRISLASSHEHLEVGLKRLTHFINRIQGA